MGESFEFGVGDRQLRRALRQLSLGTLSVGDVLMVEDYAPHARIVQQVVGDSFEPAPRAVFVPNAGFYRRRVYPGLGQGLGQLIECLLQVVGVNVVGGIGADHLFRPVA